QRGQHMRTQQDRRDKPGECRDLDRAGRAAHRKIDREGRESSQASEQPRRHECAMACARQRVITRRWVQQSIETIADDIQYRHGSRASAMSSKQTRRNAPFMVATPCQSEIKRTLRLAGQPPRTACSRGFRAGETWHSMQMVNVGFPERTWYGFEIVDTPRPPPSIENLHRIQSSGFLAGF